VAIDGGPSFVCRADRSVDELKDHRMPLSRDPDKRKRQLANLRPWRPGEAPNPTGINAISPWRVFDIPLVQLKDQAPTG
jgi:hypothetical protein